MERQRGSANLEAESRRLRVQVNDLLRCIEIVEQKINYYESGRENHAMLGNVVPWPEPTTSVELGWWVEIVDNPNGLRGTRGRVVGKDKLYAIIKEWPSGDVHTREFRYLRRIDPPPCPTCMND